MKKKRSKKHIGLYLVLIVMAAATLFPILYTVTNSFMGAQEIAEYYEGLSAEVSTGSPLHLIPRRATLSGYTALLLERPHYLMKFWTSLGLCAVIVLGQIVIAVLGGYAFAKFRFPGYNGIFFFLIALMMMPYQVMLVPSYMVMDQLGLVGSYTALILPAVFSAFGVFLMRQVFAAIPDSLLESARIDSAGNWRILWQVVLPNCKSGLFSLLVLCFIDTWNMVEQPLVFLRESYQYPLAVFLLEVNKTDPALGFACGLLSMLPVLVLFLFFDEEMISGIGYSIIK